MLAAMAIKIDVLLHFLKNNRYKSSLCLCRMLPTCAKTKTTNDNPNVTKTLTKILSACPFSAEKAYQTRLVCPIFWFKSFLVQ